MNWQTKDELFELLCNLVHYQSITGSKEEVAIAEFIFRQFTRLDYFKDYPNHLHLSPIKDGRHIVSALVKRGNTPDTIVLLSHFDVVDVEDYGSLKNLAFDPKELTKQLMKDKSQLPRDVKEDLETGEWIFGRGTMDMKAGIALHMSLLEQACYGQFDGNILFLSVPDEEVNSAGMREAVSILTDLSKKYNLQYKACLNSEPVFSKYPGDKNNYLYTGSIGKVLPGFLCYGKETHVGEPFSGLNANMMASEISKQLEINPEFCERVGNEVTPPPTSLLQRDLKEEYSVQIPHASVILFNALMMKRKVSEMTELLLSKAGGAAQLTESHFLARAEEYALLETSYKPNAISVNVMTYEQMLEEVIKTFGSDEVDRKMSYVKANFTELDDRNLTIKIVYELASLIKHMAPMIILFYSPPFYPSVCSSSNPMISEVVKQTQKFCKDNFDIEIQEQLYFPGMSDLSYTGLNDSVSQLNRLVKNMPLFKNGYELPIDELANLNIPVLNIGPVGRDAHKWTERLEVSYAFETLHQILPFTIRQLLSESIS